MSRPGILCLVIGIFGMPYHSRKMFIAMLGAVAMRCLVQKCLRKTKIQHCLAVPAPSSHAGVLLGLPPTSQSKTLATSTARSPAKSTLSCPSPVPYPSLPSPPSLSPPYAALVRCSRHLAAKAELTGGRRVYSRGDRRLTPHVFP